VALLLYLLVMVAAPLAEARAQDPDRSIHLESEGSPNCPTAHNHLLCPVCRCIEVPFSPASSPRRPAIAYVVVVAGPWVPLVAEHGGVFGRALGPRAPPLS
jgi:hypothetical protein